MTSATRFSACAGMAWRNDKAQQIPATTKRITPCMMHTPPGAHSGSQRRLARKMPVQWPLSTLVKVPDPVLPRNVPEKWTVAPSCAAGMVQLATPDAETVPESLPALTRPSITPLLIRTTVDQRPEGMQPLRLSQFRRQVPSNGCGPLGCAAAGAIGIEANAHQTTTME